MATTKGTPTRFSNFIEKQLLKSTKSQREIADAVGYKNQNMITMLKQGDVKLALDRVPDMARALNVDPLDLFKLALTQSFDEKSVKVLTEIIEGGISPVEKRILAVIRKASGDQLPEMDAEQEAKLAELFG